MFCNMFDSFSHFSYSRGTPLKATLIRQTQKHVFLTVFSVF